MTPSARRMTPEEQYAALNVLDFLSDMVTVSGKESFTKTDMLLFLDYVRSEPELFDPDVVVAQQEATRGIGE